MYHAMNTPFKGKLEKLSWVQARSDIENVNPEFAKIIDDLNPGDDH